MFLNRPIFPKSQVKWAYPIIASIFWISLTYWLKQTISLSTATLDVATVFLTSIALAYFQHSFSRDK